MLTILKRTKDYRLRGRMAHEGLYSRRDCSKLAGVNEGSTDSIDCEGDEVGVIGRFDAGL